MWVFLLVAGGIAILVPLFIAILKGVGTQPVWEKLADVEPDADSTSEATLGGTEQVLLDAGAVQNQTTESQSHRLGNETRVADEAMGHLSAN
jgi:hypothetical protein